MSMLLSEAADRLFDDAIELADRDAIGDALEELCARAVRSCGVEAIQAELWIGGIAHRCTSSGQDEHLDSRCIALFDHEVKTGVIWYAFQRDEFPLSLLSEIERLLSRVFGFFCDRCRVRILHRRNDALGSLTNAVLPVAASSDYGQAVKASLNLVTDYFGAIGASAWMYERDRRSLVMRYVSDGYLEGYVGWELPIDRVGPFSSSLLENRSFITPRYLAWLTENPDIASTIDPGLDSGRDIAALVGHAEDVTLLGIPITGGDGLMGSIIIMFETLPDDLRDPRSDFLSAVGGVIAGALASAARNERLMASENALEAELNEQNRVLKETTAQLRRAARANARVQEVERRDIARELHDTTSQVFTGLTFKIKSLLDSPLFASTEERRELTEIEQLVRTIHSQQRSIVEMLDPSLLRKRGLVVAISNMLTPYMADETVEWGFVVKGDPRRLGPETEKAVYRIVGEAVSNAARHSGAGKIDVVLNWRAVSMEIDVIDDGCGFDISRPSSDGEAHHGLLNMEDRAMLAGAHLGIISTPGGGTSVHLVVPYDSSETS